MSTIKKACLMILKYAIVTWLCSLTVEIFDVHLTGEVL